MYSLGGSVDREATVIICTRAMFKVMGFHCLAFSRLIDMLYLFSFVSIVYFLILDIFLFCVFFFIFF